MYDDDAKQNILDDLESKVISITDTALALASQGYLINKAKITRLEWSSILLHAFENIDILDGSQQTKLEELYYKITKL